MVGGRELLAGLCQALDVVGLEIRFPAGTGSQAVQGIVQ
jgi:hypothetical protein